MVDALDDVRPREPLSTELDHRCGYVVQVVLVLIRFQPVDLVSIHFIVRAVLCHCR